MARIRHRLLVAVVLLSIFATPALAQTEPFDAVGFDVGLAPVAEGFDRPLFVTNAGDDRLFVVEKAGRIRIIENDAVLEPPFLDITNRVGSDSSEQGLLGLAFAPNFAGSGLFYVNYTDLEGNTVVSRFHVADDDSVAQSESEKVILTQDQPFPNHNGGMLAFGPDNYLYIGFGDGGGQGDPSGNGQALDTWLGKILRIEVDPEYTNGEPYAVPEYNPFVEGLDALPEIWAYGLRNPWRFSFDRETGDLWIGDVGGSAFEEINRLAVDDAGANLGWEVMEGPECSAGEDCTPADYVPPVFSYTHEFGCSVTGGYVSRGEEFAGLNGAYVFADYCSGLIWGLGPDGEGGYVASEPIETGLSVSSFGEGADGRIYLTDLSGGVYELVPPL